MPDFGEKIRFLLSEKGISQAELARRLDTSPQNVTSLLKQKKPQVDTIQKVATAIGVEFYELVAQQEEMGSLLHRGGGRLPDRSKEMIPFWDVDFFKPGSTFESTLKKAEPSYYLDAPDFTGCLAFRAHTDAMDGLIKPGSIIFTTKVDEWTSHLEFGQVYLIVCRDGRKYLRYVKRHRENNKDMFLLESANKFYDEFELPKAAIDSVWLIHGHLSKRI
jgi:transcriptional regulator with XRE-family HTH domain